MAFLSASTLLIGWQKWHTTSFLKEMLELHKWGPIPSPPLPSFPLPLEVGPLISARGSGGALQLPQQGRAEPGRQTVFGEFQAKNLASSSNDLQELFRKWNIRRGWLGGRVVTYLTFVPECRRSGVRIPVGKKTSLFVYIYRRYLINVLLLYIEFLRVLLIMISSIIIIAQRRSTVDR